MVDRQVDRQHVVSLILLFDIFRCMVDREVDWPAWVVLGRSWDLCMRSWAALGAYVGGPGPSWAEVGGPEPLLGPMLAVLGRLGPKSGPGPSGKAIWREDLGRKVARARAGPRSAKGQEA